jgi:NADH-quinone oxidoreductase subunit F
MNNKERKQWKTASLDEITAFIRSIDDKSRTSPCPVDRLKTFLGTVSPSSCGECVICREGLYQLKVVAESITQGQGRDVDVEIIEDISGDLVIGASCDYGKEVGKIIRDLIAKEAEVFNRHIKRKRCEALVCNKLVSFYIAPEQCTGCGQCLTACPKGAIAGGDGQIHVIDQGRCSRCGDCEAVCRDQAVKRSAAVLPKLPEAPVLVGSFSAEASGGGLMARKRRRKAE